ncbi:hypothetical protein C7I55_07860 [Sphingomonas deserti]|uniref:Uncharacterized protein n=2 Tax=Allosphingosinicella deserti TaxID=2116704 RepID=A0A2P7QW20_9SPHN|nr:hypothetical protein C7I55_07860 [Sphingomonas deserti]
MFQATAMPVLTESDVRFHCLRAVQSLPKAIIRDLSGKPETRERALVHAADILAGRFAGLTITAPDLRPNMDWGAMKN